MTNSHTQRKNIDDLQTIINSLDGKVIYFGHQSVGSNILEGIQDLLTSTGQHLNIRSLKEFGSSDASMYHSYIGRNYHPEEKILEFTRLMNEGLGDKLDIAFMKFCFVDAENLNNENIEQILHDYIVSMSDLEKKFPNVTFVYLTMPLTSKRTDFLGRIKNGIKTVLNKPIIGRDDNISRNHFNKLLRSEKGGTGRLFDIADLQATRDDNAKVSFRMAGKDYYAMDPRYTYDGGHLNEIGRGYIAYELLKFLSGL